MVDISKYMDYRRFLHDCYAAAKKKNPRFSYQAFSEKAGISSKGLLFNVLKGRRHLSKSHVIGMGKALKLNKHQFDYFETLFSYNCSVKVSDKRHYFERLIAIKASGSASWQPQVVRNEQYEFYSNWFHSVVRSLIGMHGFSGDCESLSRLLSPSITPGQVKKSIDLLCSLGFINKTAKGTYSLVHRTIATEPEVVSLAVQSFHSQMGELALAALKTLPPDRRNFSSLTVGTSEGMFREICKDIEEFRTFLLKKIENDHSASRVYQINLQCFPVSIDPDARRKS
jgi:uncharacterized protein (TIGR02147 family)